MAKQNEGLFEESSQGAVSAVTVILVVVSFILAFGGMVFGGYAFIADLPDLQATIIFSASLVATTLGFMLPMTLLPLTGK